MGRRCGIGGARGQTRVEISGGQEPGIFDEFHLAPYKYGAMAINYYYYILIIRPPGPQADAAVTTPAPPRDCSFFPVDPGAVPSVAADGHDDVLMAPCAAWRRPPRRLSDENGKSLRTAAGRR